MKRMTATSRLAWPTALGAALFVVWSGAMVMVGTVLSEVGLTRSHAAASKSLVRLDGDRLGGNNLGEFEPYEPENGNLIARGHTFFISADENFSLGVWETKPGELSIPEPYLEDELMYVLDGKIVLIDDQGNREECVAGEGVVLLRGWTGTFPVPEGARKVWVSCEGGKR